MPKVSVIMPCYNHATFVADSINSILSQSLDDLELIVIDDCSSDISKDIIQKFAYEDSRVVPIFHEINGGEAKSRNDGLAIAKGDFIGFCDSDDLWEKEKLFKQIKYLEKKQEIGAVHSDSIIINEVGIPTGMKFSTLFQKEDILEGNLFLKFCLRNFINVPTVLLRKKCINDVGQFEQAFRYLTDWIYWAKVSRNHLFGYISDSLARYRIHSSSTMHDNKTYPIYRIMGYKLLLEKYSNNIPRNVRTKMEYLIGVNYLSLGKTYEAKNYFRKALATQPWNFKGIYRSMLLSLQEK